MAANAPTSAARTGQAPVTHRRRAVPGTLLVAAGLLAAALFTPAAARAASVRYAAPTPLGTADCSSPGNACSLTTATEIGALHDGDEVVLAPGEYTLGAELDILKAVSVHGTGAPAATRIVSSAPTAIYLGNAGAYLRDLEIDGSDLSSAVFAAVGSVEEAVVRNNVGSACSVSMTTIRDTLCLADGASGSGVFINYSGGTHLIGLVNVTAVVTGSTNAYGIYAGAGTGATVYFEEAVDVIARGTTDDISASADSTSTSIVEISHSNFSHVFQFAQPGGTAAVTSPSTNSNQTAAPAFVDAAAGDFHEAAGSVTIDAGVAEVANGTLDFDGDARELGAAVDIGADEYLPPSPPPPPPPPPPPSGGGAGGSTPPAGPGPSVPVPTPPNTSIISHPHPIVTSKKPKSKVVFRFTSSDPAARFECSIDGARFAPCTSAHSVTVKPGRHRFEVRAVDQGGTDPSPAIYHWTVKAAPGRVGR
jgi:hypothetical protein